MTTLPKIVKLKTGSPYEEKRSYSRAICIGDWILVANTAGRNLKTKVMPTDPAEQAKQCFINIAGALQAVDASLADIVRYRIAIPNLDHKEAVMGVVAEAFRGIDPVATITACPLASAEYLVEIEVTAYRGFGAAEVEHKLVPLGA